MVSENFIERKKSPQSIINVYVIDKYIHYLRLNYGVFYLFRLHKNGDQMGTKHVWRQIV